MKRAAVLLQCLAALLCLAAAVRYMTAQEFMPYHAAVAGRTWQSLEPGLQTVMLGMLRILGGGFLACGIALAALAWPVSRGHAWGSWTALATGAAVWVPTLSVTLLLKGAQPAAQPPTLPTAGILGLVVVASLLGVFGAKAAPSRAA